MGFVILGSEITFSAALSDPNGETGRRAVILGVLLRKGLGEIGVKRGSQLGIRNHLEK